MLGKAWEWAFGGCNMHFPLTFDDGFETLVRFRRYRGDVPEEMLLRVVEHEVVALEALAKAGCLVPHAWRAPSQTKRKSSRKGGARARTKLITGKRDLHPYFFIERVSGTPLRMPNGTPPDEFIRSYAEEAIRRSSLKYTNIGSPNADGTIGPLATGYLFNSPSAPYFFGPFTNNRDRYLCNIDNKLEMICRLVYCRKSSTYAYIFYSVMRELVAADAELAEPALETYIAHADEIPSQFLIDDKGKLLTVIDWEW